MMTPVKTFFLPRLHCFSADWLKNSACSKKQSGIHGAIKEHPAVSTFHQQVVNIKLATS
jgi:hypothetical protein